jgi:CBS domain-containing membrane protein
MPNAKVVAAIMTRDPICLQEEDDLWELQEEMRNLALHHVPVLDGKKLVGIVSQRDLLRFTTSAMHRNSLHSALDARDKQSTFVASIMTADVQTIGPDTPVEEAARLLSRSTFTCLPVVASDRTLLGVVTEKDVLRVLLG